MIRKSAILYTSIAIVSLLFISPGVSFAQAPTGSEPPGVGERAAAAQATIISRLKTRADNEITRRITALTNLITRISVIKRLTSDQKTSLTSQIQDQIASLGTLKTKIDADIDLPTLRTDVQSIVKSYRIFALYIPKTYIIANADRLLNIVDALTLLQGKLQVRIDTAKSAGNDTTTMQNLIADMTSKLADAKTQATNAINTVLPLTPDGYPGNKTTLQNARSMLVTARQDIQVAHKNEQTIRQDLVQMGFRVNAKITPVGPTPTP